MTAEDSAIKKETLSDQEDIEFDGDELLSLEKLDRDSPELWKDKIPGLNAFVLAAETPIRMPNPEWARGMNQDDISDMLKLASMTAHELVLEVKRLNDDAFRLGACEAKEMSRGKMLKIFKRSPR